MANQIRENVGAFFNVAYDSLNLAETAGATITGEAHATANLLSAKYSMITEFNSGGAGSTINMTTLKVYTADNSSMTSKTLLMDVVTATTQLVDYDTNGDKFTLSYDLNSLQGSKGFIQVELVTAIGAGTPNFDLITTLALEKGVTR